MASSFETTLFPIVQTINEYLSNYVLVILLLGIGIWYTIKTRCVQVRCFKEGWNRVFGNITLNGKKGGDGYVQFAEEYFNKLVKSETTDEFSRPATKWTNKGDKIGTYADKADVTYTKNVELGDI